MRNISAEEMASLLPSLEPERNKYQAGYVVALAGSPDLEGAAILACSSALRAGAGIVRLLYHEEMRLPPCLELVHQKYDRVSIPQAAQALSKASAVLMGPGIGKKGLAADAFLQLVNTIKGPCCLDADALNLLSEHRDLKPPEGAILTPHLGELGRLLGKQTTPQRDDRLLKECQQLSEKWRCTLVLKGGPTFVFHPGEQPYRNPFGNPGMATAGTGDVLTGVIAAFLAQKLSPHQAALLGVYIHSRAGDLAAEKLTPYSMIATDLRDLLPTAFKELLVRDTPVRTLPPLL